MTQVTFIILKIALLNCIQLHTIITILLVLGLRIKGQEKGLY